MNKKIMAIAILIALGGCATSPNRYMAETNAVDMTGAFQLVPRDEFEDIDLARLVDPMGKASLELSGKSENLNSGQKIDAALAQFYGDRGTTTAEKRAARDRIQERILAASTQRCNAFKGNLQRQFSRNNFVLGLGSTISGVVGAVVPGVQASKNLAAASGIFSGARAEWNQDFLSNVAVNVIIDGIEQRQQDVYRQIVLAGQTRTLEEYSLEAAIKDALFYHGQCSIMTGLRVASDAIKFTNDPGIDAATRILLKLNNAKKISSGATDIDLSLPAKLDQLTISQRLFAGTPRGIGPDAGSLLRTMFSTKQRIHETTTLLLGALETFEGKKGSDAQSAVSAYDNAAISGIAACDAKALETVSAIAETQAQLENPKDNAAKIELTGKLDTKSKLAVAIAGEVERRKGEYEDVSTALQRQMSGKNFKPAETKDRVSERLNPLKTAKPDVCN